LTKPGRLFDRTTVFFVVLAIVSATMVGVTHSRETMIATVESGVLLFLSITPMLVLGLFLGGLVKGLTDPDQIAPLLGPKSGLRGLLLATVLGAFTPGGPFAAFPIVYALFAAGADVGAVIAFLTSWAVIAVHRIVIWELPLIGPDFVVLRVLISLPLPILAGLHARWLVTRFERLGVIAIVDRRADGPADDGGAAR
jgi:uncharacterized membrane protein YraQ (UPF0718 family)